MMNNRRRNLSNKAKENIYFIKPDIDLSHLKDKLFYYPFSGSDWDVPIQLFRDTISEFWFVDSNYSFTKKDLRFFTGGIFNEMKRIDTSFVGYREMGIVGTRFTEKGESYKYLQPGMLTNIYLYKYRKIKINFRRGYDYTSLFGPSELEIAEPNLGIFFLRGTSSEGGSNHLWFNSKKSLMLCGYEKISLPKKLIHALSDGSLIVLDGSLTGERSSKKKLKNVYQHLSPFYCNNEIPLREAMERANPFQDKEGNSFTCIGYVGRKNGLTLIWQVKKAE